MMVHRSACDTCDERIDWVSRTAKFGDDCPFCEFGTLEPVGMAGCVMGIGKDIRPEAMELVEEWREKADTLADINQNHGIENWGEIGQIEILADELEELIEDTWPTAQEGVSE